jgi:TRAP-type C4-dicarboxylate transport system permease small subunit
METPQGQEKEKLNPVLSAITYVFDAAYSVLLTYSQAVLLVIVLIVSAEVISRKFLGTSIRWSEEVALFLMVWMAFISMAIGVQKGLHIALGFFYGLLPKKAAWFVGKMDLLVIMGFGCFMVYYGARLVMSTMTSTLPATQWPAGLMYVMIPVGGVFIVYFTLLDFFGLQQYEHKKFYRDDPEEKADSQDGGAR